jgi:hypothetical protein
MGRKRETGTRLTTSRALAPDWFWGSDSCVRCGLPGGVVGLHSISDQTTTHGEIPPRLVRYVRMIDEEQLSELTAWLTQSGLAGESELALVVGFCERAVAAGLPLARAHVLIDTLDPVHEGHVFRWGHDASLPPEEGYGRTTRSSHQEDWKPLLCRRRRTLTRGAAAHSIACGKLANRCCGIAYRRRTKPNTMYWWDMRRPD